MVDLTRKPFNLNEKQIAWVEETIAGMTLEEKLGQLFIPLKQQPGADEEWIKAELERTHQGGLRWGGGTKEVAYLQNVLYQKHARIPLLIAANCDCGGNGVAPDGTFVSTAVEAGCGDTEEIAYHMGLVAGREAAAVGVNWMFNPICDILMNWRNSVVNTRSFGGSVERVLAGARGYIRGIREGAPNMAVCAKHFPGDGVEELDQHLALGINSLSAEEWEKSFGYIYRTLIDEGLDTIMVGHIAQPAMSRKLRPGIRDEEIMPATLAPELVTDLLRGELGFNGLVVTDSTIMLGMTAMCRREDAVPLTIAAGCDMFLFYNDREEDMEFMRRGYEKGVITEERLSDALHRILGMKAKLKLYDEKVRIPDPALKDKVIGCEEHRAYTVQAADSAITLVKDTQNILPLDVNKQKRVYLVWETTPPSSLTYKPDPVKKVFIEELEAAGFQVEVCPDYRELEFEEGPSPRHIGMMMSRGKRSEFIAKYDVVLLVLNIARQTEENNTRLRWGFHHSREMPWYIPEVPTIGISLSLVNHMIDLPQLKTMIHAYNSNRENIQATIQKMCGKSPFRGVAEDTVFCDRWEARL